MARLACNEIRALRRLQREQGPSSYVFMTERAGPMTPKAFHALFGRIGTRAKMPFPIHPHMLRHACGYALANAGHDTRRLQAYLGYKNIQHTVRYTELAPDLALGREGARQNRSVNCATQDVLSLTAHKSPTRVRFRANRTLSGHHRNDRV
jgi:integrase